MAFAYKRVFLCLKVHSTRFLKVKLGMFFFCCTFLIRNRTVGGKTGAGDDVCVNKVCREGGEGLLCSNSYNALSQTRRCCCRLTRFK